MLSRLLSITESDFRAMESIKVLTMVDEAGIRDLKKRELIKYVFMLRKVVLKQAEKISYQKSKISTLVRMNCVERVDFY